MTIREQLELREMDYLSPYATKSSASLGRKKDEPECDLRPVFQRDRDRILYENLWDFFNFTACKCVTL